LSPATTALQHFSAGFVRNNTDLMERARNPRGGILFATSRDTCLLTLAIF